MNEIKYYCPFQEGVGKGPQMSICISSKMSLALSAPNFLMFVHFPFMHSTQTSKSDKSKGSRISSDTSL